MEKRNKFEMWALEVEVEHTELDDLDLDKQEWMQQAKVEAAEISEAKNKKMTKKDRKQKRLYCRWWSVYQNLIREEVTVMIILM